MEINQLKGQLFEQNKMQNPEILRRGSLVTNIKKPLLNNSFNNPSLQTFGRPVAVSTLHPSSGQIINSDERKIQLYNSSAEDSGSKTAQENNSASQSIHRGKNSSNKLIERSKFGTL